MNFGSEINYESEFKVFKQNVAELVKTILWKTKKKNRSQLK